MWHCSFSPHPRREVNPCFESVLFLYRLDQFELALILARKVKLKEFTQASVSHIQFSFNHSSQKNFFVCARVRVCIVKYYPQDWKHWASLFPITCQVLLQLRVFLPLSLLVKDFSTVLEFLCKYEHLLNNYWLESFSIRNEKWHKMLPQNFNINWEQFSLIKYLFGKPERGNLENKEFMSNSKNVENLTKNWVNCRSI